MRQSGDVVFEKDTNRTAPVVSAVCIHFVIPILATSYCSRAGRCVSSLVKATNASISHDMVLLTIRVSHCMVCVSVLEDNQRALTFAFCAL